jgi:L-rhamnose-H+ transport protein
MAVALGYCTVFGTLIPPIVNGSIGAIAASNSGHFILLGMLFCVIGIAVSGLAGMKKEKELDDEQKKATIKEFNFVKGMLIATFSGIMSSCMAYGIAAGKPVASIAMQHLSAVGGLDLWKNLPTMIVVLLGGFTTNVIWCLILSFNNRSFPEYFGIVKASADEPSSSSPAPIKTKAPLLNNYVFSALAGITWYLQFFFYSMGTVKMGAYDFSSWTLHMASIIIFSSIWGIALHEWKGSSKKTFNVLFAGIGVLVFSTVVVGYGNYIQKGEQDKAKAKAVSISIPARGLIRQSEAPVYFHGKS